MKNIIKTILFFVISLTVLSNTVFASAALDTDIGSIKEVMDLINNNYKTKVPNQQLVDGAIKGMLNSLDPHSTYFTKEEYESFLQSINGGYSGIGVNIKKIDKYIQVIGVMKDSPAQRVGIKEGDKFITVGDISAVDMEIDIFVAKVKGPKGTKIKLGIIRDDLETPLVLEVMRDNIKVTNVEYKILEGNIGFIKIYEFGADGAEEVKEALKKFDENNVLKVIVDLRGNPGGYLDVAANICKNFIPKGPIVYVKTNSDEQIYNSDLKEQKYKLAVLVDGGSASASEIVAGAVKDTKAGVIIGTKTYGKGTVQTFFKLDDGNYIKLTIANYLTPNKNSVDGVGINPDFVIKNPNLVSMDNLGELDVQRNVYVGQKGEDVFAVEQRLKVLGYDVGGPDYIYDNITQKAVLEYKKSHKIAINRIITKGFQKKLDKEIIDSIGKDTQLLKAIEILNIS